MIRSISENQFKIPHMLQKKENLFKLDFHKEINFIYVFQVPYSTSSTPNKLCRLAQ